MVLHPLVSETTSAGENYAPAWPVIERAQHQVAREYWLVSQPDHAALAGALAARFISPQFPAIDPLIARAIEVHDSGWAMFDCERAIAVPPAVDGRGKPLSFLEIAPPDFLRAWIASIDRAESVCPDGGYIVSRHFCALGERRLACVADTPEDTARMRFFLRNEVERQRRLKSTAACDGRELERLLLVLQFCDVLSLYLCAGAGEAVEFPHRFDAGTIRMHRENQAFVLDPSPFRAGREDDSIVSVGVEARLYPAVRPTTTILPFLLW